jgi:hypothetical protein
VISVAVVVAFFICWAPFHAQRLFAIYSKQQQTPVMLQIYEIMTYISGILYYVSTTINPILYHTMSLKFREAFKVTTLQQMFCLAQIMYCARKLQLKVSVVGFTVIERMSDGKRGGEVT